jgi:hypothetical protein
LSLRVPGPSGLSVPRCIWRPRMSTHNSSWRSSCQRGSSPADTDRHALHQQGAVLHVRVRDVLDASGPLLARHNRHRAHMRIVAPGCRVCVTPLG